MQPGQQTIPIESLPRDVLSLIISKVASGSREDVCSCLMSCKELGVATEDFHVFRSMNLYDIVVALLLALDACSQVMAKFLAHDNPSAHYVAGLLDYFHHQNPVKGMNHFHVAANAKLHVKEVVYLYGVIKLCTGEYEVGENYLDTLGSHYDDLENVKCWTNIKRSLHEIGNVERPEYVLPLLEMLPSHECNCTTWITHVHIATTTRDV